MRIASRLLALLLLLTFNTAFADEDKITFELNVMNGDKTEKEVEVIKIK